MRLVSVVSLFALVSCAKDRGGSSSPSSPSSQDEPQSGESAQASAPAGDEPPGEMRGVLEAHNKARAEHCAEPLAWSTEIQKSAQAWADKLRERNCAFKHSETKYGENLWGGSAGAFGPDDVVGKWVDERKVYRYGDGGFSGNTGHFTQVVWKQSQRVGCGSVECKGQQIVVCQYDPPGNFKGQFAQNVSRPKCK